MDLDTLLREGRRLSRESFALTTDPTGEPVALWYGLWNDRAILGVGDHEYQDVMSILGRVLPTPMNGVVHISIDLDDCGGMAVLDPVDELPDDESATKLFAHVARPLAPTGVLQHHSIAEVTTWLENLNSSNTDDWDIAMEYWEAWLDETRRREDLYAFVGGWHEGWASESWSERLGQQLLIWTFRDSEPYVQVWLDGGSISVVQRLST